VELHLGPEWGGPEIAHMILRQMLRMRERIEVRDAAWFLWEFERATVRAFWTSTPRRGTPAP